MCQLTSDTFCTGAYFFDRLSRPFRRTSTLPQHSLYPPIGDQPNYRAERVDRNRQPRIEKSHRSSGSVKYHRELALDISPKRGGKYGMRPVSTQDRFLEQLVGNSWHQQTRPI